MLNDGELAMFTQVVAEVGSAGRVEVMGLVLTMERMLVATD